MEDSELTTQGTEKKSSRKWIFLAVGGFFFYMLLLFWLAGQSVGLGTLPDGDMVAQINIDGVISGDGDASPFDNAIGPQEIISLIKQAEEDPYIKAILLRVNSPGGTAGSSQEIAAEVKRAKKPVVVSVGDIGASGAYWIASAADSIVAGPASEVGSIGVIITIPNLQELFKKLGIDMQTIAQGKYKDMGNPARPLTEEERKILSDQSEGIYELFIREVAKGRKLSVKKVRSYATGLTYTGEDALKMGLVDKLGNYSDAVKEVGRIAGIKGKPHVTEMQGDSFFDWFGFLTGGSGVLSSLDGLWAEKLLGTIPLPAPAPIKKAGER